MRWLPTLARQVHIILLSAADQIYVSPASLVGSIGVIMQGFGIQELTKKLGVEDRTMTAGQHKAIMNPFKPISPEEKSSRTKNARYHSSAIY